MFIAILICVKHHAILQFLNEGLIPMMERDEEGRVIPTYLLCREDQPNTIVNTEDMLRLTNNEPRARTDVSVFHAL